MIKVRSYPVVKWLKMLAQKFTVTGSKHYIFEFYVIKNFRISLELKISIFE